MDLIRIFSLKSRFTFFLLVAALCIFSVAAWWSVQRLVRSEVEARLRAHADRIEMAVKERMGAQAGMLFQLRGQLPPGPMPGEATFRRMVERSEMVPRNPGLRHVGFAQLRARDGGVLSAPISLLEPQDWRGERLLGRDLGADPARQTVLAASLSGGEIAVTSAGTFFRRRDGTSDIGFLFFLPVFPAAAARIGERPTGVVFAAFDAREFFEDIFGLPSLKREAVNFSAELLGPGGFPLYNRFEASAHELASWMIIRREVSIPGGKIALDIFPLERFFSFGDRYLAIIVGLGAALVSCLIMVALRVSQNQLDFEILAKEASMEAARQSRRQVENLRRLNEFDRALAGELDTDSLLDKFSAIIGQLTEPDASFVYFKESAKKRHLRLKAFHGIARESFRTDSLPEPWLEKMVTQSLVLRKGSPGSDSALETLLGGEGEYSDWFLYLLSTREGGRCGLIFVARKNGLRFSEVEKELIESMVTQFASSAEIAQLFLRVEDANKAKNAFLANMSHEIRTPLGAIIGFAEMIARGDFSPGQRADISAGLRKNGEQLTCIIDDILDLAKVDAGKMQIERKRVSLASVLHEVHSVMTARARGKKIHFSIETAGRIPAFVETDDIRLKQILMNVVGNAVKFTEKGSVRLVVRHLPAEGRRNFIAFTVKDTGIGIPDESQESLFRPFSQVDVSSTRRFGGSGLGLVLSQRLAQELGGGLELVESISGQGSTFEARVEVGDLANTTWIQNPFPKLSPAPATLPRKTPRLDGARILLVEDSEDNQDIFRYFLEGSGANAKIVKDGNEAVKAAAKENFDLILMDIQIPGIDGKEATRRIRRQGFSRPIVALTAHAMPEEQQSCLKAGCVGQITKPVSGEALVGQVANYLRRA